MTSHKDMILYIVSESVNQHTHVSGVVWLAFGGVPDATRDRLLGGWLALAPDCLGSGGSHVVDSLHGGKY